jgi:hypothetical protein
MKHKLRFGIYGKVMAYTLLILLVVVVVAAIFFSGQISSVLENMERQQLSIIFSPLTEQLVGKSDEEAIRFSEEFHARNAAFEFYIVNQNEEVIYRTSNAAISDNDSVFSNDNSQMYYYGREINNQI